MIELSCLCGEVRVAVARRPDFIHECNCTLCRKTGARWGYYDPTEVTVRGITSGYVRTDKAEGSAEVRFCAVCGATTHFGLTAAAQATFGNAVAGANMALADPRDLAGIELRFPDGANWDGAGEFGYVRPPRVIGEE